MVKRASFLKTALLNAVVCRLCAPMAGVGIDTNPYRIRYP